MRSLSRALLVVFVAIAVTGLTPLPSSAATFLVNSVGDGGDTNLADGICNDGTGSCTLRAGIQQANNTVILDTIEFNITPNTITPASELPTISDPVLINGFDPTGRVELVGSGIAVSADGLSVDSSPGADGGTTIRGLVIRNFTNDGIDITAAASGTRIESSFIGTDGTGAVDQGNGGHGIDINGAANIIGGSGVGNVISGNGQDGSGSGIEISAASNFVEGNFIGTNTSGTAAISNDDHGVVITQSATANRVGGSTSATRNIISGNGQDGVRVQGGATSNLIQGNFIGTDGAGSSAIPNAVDGVGLRTAASANTVGGSATGTGNIISGNGDDGIQAGQVAETTTVNNAILGNSIVSNVSIGIDLLGPVGSDGVDANDAGDPDTGGNNLQNSPVIASASSGATTTTIGGTLNSGSSTTYRLEFFSNAACDPSGNGEGEIFVGSTNVTTDGAGNAAFTATFSTAVAVGRQITGTATDPSNNTSEFSACRAVAQGQDPPASDTAPPTTPTTNAGPKYQKQQTFTISWGPSTDNQAGQIRYDIRYREAPYNGGFGTFVGWQAATTTTSASFTGTAGRTYCFSARAIDGAGNASPYGAEGCTSVPVDNTSFKHRGKWSKRTGAGYYLNTFSRTKQRGARLTLPAVQAKVLSIIVSKCRGCGVIKVFFKGKLLKKIVLRTKAATRQKLRFVNLKTFASPQTGTVRVTVVSRRKLVIVEGLGVSAV